MRGRVGDVVVLALLAWWSTYMTWGSGGREPHLLSVGLTVLALALVAVRPWERVSGVVLMLTLLVSGAALLVPLVAPTGLEGASEGAAWVFAGVTALLVSAWAQASWRREALLVALVVAPLLSFAKGWMAWWGGGDASRPFLGTFYWHNQEAIFLLLGTVSGLALALTSRGPLRSVGWLATCLCGAGVIVSTSRASMAVLALSLAVMLVAALVVRAWAVARGVVLASGLVAGAVWLLTGPPFFPARSGVLSGTERRAGSGETLAANGGHRLDDWVWSVKVFRHWPVSGSGFHGFAAASRQLDPDGRGSLTPFAHNGFLQLIVDGGLLLGVPVLMALVCVAALALRRVAPAVRSQDWATFAMVVALGALGLHSAVDFDWSYPSLLTAFGLVSGLLAADVTKSQPRRGRALAGGLLVLLVLVAVVAAWPGGLHLNAPLGSHA